MDFPRIKRLPPYVFNIIGDLQQQARRAGEDIIDFGMGNPDGATPPHVVAKLIEAVQKPPNHRYSVSRGIYKLRLAITDWYRRRYDVDARSRHRGRRDDRFEGRARPSGDGGTRARATSCSVRAPTYPIHQYSVILAGGDLRSVPMVPGQDFFENLVEALRQTWPKPKLLILNFPHNPTTTVVDRGFFERIVDFARENEFLVVHDLAYADLVFDGYQAPSFLEVPGAKEVGVEFFTLSKSYNMPGWRVGFCVGNAEDDRGAGADQELPRLRHLPTDPDRRDRRSERAAALRRGDSPGLRERGATFWSRVSTAPAGCSRNRKRPCSSGRRFRSPTGPWARSSFPSSCCRRRRSRCRRGSASASTATTGFASRLIENEQRTRQAVRGIRTALIRRPRAAARAAPWVDADAGSCGRTLEGDEALPPEAGRTDAPGGDPGAEGGTGWPDRLRYDRHRSREAAAAQSRADPRSGRRAGIDLVRIADIDTKRDRGVRLARGVLVPDARAILDDPEHRHRRRADGRHRPGAPFRARRRSPPTRTSSPPTRRCWRTTAPRSSPRPSAARCEIDFEASVGGGIPIIRTLRDGARRRSSPTPSTASSTAPTNYILSRMSSERR